MAWIELHQSLPGHKKTRQAARALGISRSEFIGHIVQFWLWALDNAPSGVLDGIDAETIADVSDFHGDSQVYLIALIAAGFIDDDDETMRIHDWHDYAGKLVESRRKDRERKRLQAGKQVNPQEIPGNSSGKNKIPSEKTNSEDTVPYRTLPYQTKPMPTSAEAGGCGDAASDDLQLAIPESNTDTPTYPEEFERWWKLYPRKIGKGKCLKLWQTWKKRIGVDKLLTACQNYATETEGRDESKIMHPSTFLATENTLPQEYAVKVIPRQGRIAATLPPPSGSGLSADDRAAQAEVEELLRQRGAQPRRVQPLKQEASR